MSGDDTISRQAAIDTFDCSIGGVPADSVKYVVDYAHKMKYRIKNLPSTQLEIIRCNSCKYWTQSTGKMNGYGLGRCDFHDADLVTCNGFCYWAERRNDDKERS